MKSKYLSIYLFNFKNAYTPSGNISLSGISPRGSDEMGKLYCSLSLINTILVLLYSLKKFTLTYATNVNDHSELCFNH